MKTPTLLRILCGLSFLIFLCPFFQMCTAENAGRSVKPDKEEVNHRSQHTGTKTDVEEAPAAFERVHIVKPFNAYELAYVLTSMGFWYIGSNFILTILFSIIIALKIFRKSYKNIQTLSVLTVVLLCIFLLMVASLGVFKNITQIKFGFYVFLANTIAIALLSRMELLKLRQKPNEYGL